MLIDLSHRWRTRTNRSWTGIRLWVPVKSPRPPGTVKRIVLHQWGPPQPTLSDTAMERIKHGASYEAEEWALRMEKTPYHIQAAVTSEGLPVVGKIWPGEAYCNHAGTQNAESIGVGVVGHFPRFAKEGDHPHPEALAVAIRQAVTMAAEEVRRMDPHQAHAQHCPAPVEVITHSQTSRKAADPGERIVAALVPLVEDGLIVVRPEWSAGNGQPWPKEWRRHFA